MKYAQPTPDQITAWVAKHFDYKSRKNGAELVINNPFNGDTGYNFNISATRLVTNDWRDNSWAPTNQRTGKRKLGFINFVQLYLNCSYRDAVKSIGDAAGSAVPTIKSRQLQVDKPEQLISMPVGSEPIVNSKDKKAAALVSRWLASRGISKRLIAEKQIHHLGTDVIFPYLEFVTIVYWQMRSMLNKRFLFPDQAKFGVSKGQFLYNFDCVEPGRILIITEAIFDCLTINKQTVASGGADLTIEQVKKVGLLRPKDGIILAPDNDEAGLKSILHNGKLLASRGYLVFYSIPPSLFGGKVIKDWNELWQSGCKDVQKELAANIRPFSDKKGQVNFGEAIRINKMLAQFGSKKSLSNYTLAPVLSL